MRKLLVFALLATGIAHAQPADVLRARDLYQRTSYEAALQVLDGIQAKDGAAYALVGRCQYMLGEFKKASEALERAVRLDSDNAEHYLWLGRAYGRRAETSSFITAPGLASKARANFEKAVMLNPRNPEAVSDLFDYYLQAPGVLGGGMDKARDLAERARDQDLAEYHSRLALISDKRKEHKDTEEQLRRAADLAPRQVGRVIELAKFLSRQGQYEESEAAFRRAEQMAPQSPRVVFERAKAYVRSKRNLELARELLVRYLEFPLTPDDPPRREAEQLLKQARSG